MKTRVVGSLAVVLALAFAGVAYAAITSDDVTGGIGATGGYIDLVIESTMEESSILEVICSVSDAGDTFDFGADVLFPGESCTFTATIRNDGNLEATLSSTETPSDALAAAEFDLTVSFSAATVAAGGTVDYVAVVTMHADAPADASAYWDVVITGSYP